MLCYGQVLTPLPAAKPPTAGKLSPAPQKLGPPSRALFVKLTPQGENWGQSSRQSPVRPSICVCLLDVYGINSAVTTSS